MTEKENLGYQILSLAQNADNRHIFKKEICILLCKRFKCREAFITIEEENSFTTWKIERIGKNDFIFSKSPQSSQDTLLAETAESAPIWSAPLEISGRSVGTLVLVPSDETGINDDVSNSLFQVAKILGQAIHFRRSQAALKERVKEITCLYEITKIMHRPQVPLEETLEKVIGVIPKAFQYPSYAEASVELDGQIYGSREATEQTPFLNSQIIISDAERGSLKVWYRDAFQTSDDREFLREEQDLLDGIVTQLSLLIEERETELEKQKLEEQLRHADRLATLGQLTAGVAHDINEPLANILGFAELLKKEETLSEQSRKDLEKIITSSIYARDNVRKLLTFTGKIMPGKTDLDLNDIIEEGLRFFETRCRKMNIKIITEFSPKPLRIIADPGHLHQILVNLLVNAIQALPDGGQIKLKTGEDGKNVVFSVEDNGTGIPVETQKNIFIPFFTTKERGEGTGLGLTTVLGIVTSYKGEIALESEPGAFTRFTIQLPGAVRVNE